jgi:hypothetical protein
MAQYPDEMLKRIQEDIRLAREKRALQNNPTASTLSGRAKYRITQQELLNLLQEQNYNCGICEKTLEDCKWVVDHEHKTGLVRGLLCTHCNAWLGTNDTKVEAAWVYLHGRMLP